MTNTSKRDIMKRLYGSITNIGKAAAQIENILNKDLIEPIYDVTADRSQGSGVVKITNTDTGKYRYFKVSYDTIERDSKTNLKWNSSYKVDKLGNVFDEGGDNIGTAFVKPNKPNSSRRDSNYKLGGKFDRTLPDVLAIDVVSDVDKLKDVLE